jgi:hypothetical protein
MSYHHVEVLDEERAYHFIQESRTKNRKISHTSAKQKLIKIIRIMEITGIIKTLSIIKIIVKMKNTPKEEC